MALLFRSKSWNGTHIGYFPLFERVNTLSPAEEFRPQHFCNGNKQQDSVFSCRAREPTRSATPGMDGAFGAQFDQRTDAHARMGIDLVAGLWRTGRARAKGSSLP